MSTGDPRRPCAGCVGEAAGLDRLAYQHERHCPGFDAFFDASDEELAAMVPPEPAGSTPVSEEPMPSTVDAELSVQQAMDQIASLVGARQGGKTTAARCVQVIYDGALARGISEGIRRATEAAYACCRCGERHVWQWRDPADRTRGGSWASRDGHGYEPLLPLHVADRLREALVGPLEPAEQSEPERLPADPQGRLRSLHAQPHGSACICRECTARDQATEGSDDRD